MRLAVLYSCKSTLVYITLVCTWKFFMNVWLIRLDFMRFCRSYFLHFNLWCLAGLLTGPSFMRFTCIWQVRIALSLPFTGPRFSGGNAYHVSKVLKLDLTLKYQAMLWTWERWHWECTTAIRPVLSFLLPGVYNLLHTYSLKKCLNHSVIHTFTYSNTWTCMPVDAHTVSSFDWNIPGRLSPICCWARTKTL